MGTALPEGHIEVATVNTGVLCTVGGAQNFVADTSGQIVAGLPLVQLVDKQGDAVNGIERVEVRAPLFNCGFLVCGNTVRNLKQTLNAVLVLRKFARIQAQRLTRVIGGVEAGSRSQILATKGGTKGNQSILNVLAVVEETMPRGLNPRQRPHSAQREHS